MGQDLSAWKGVATPERKVLEGRYVRLEPLSDGHAHALYEAVSGGDEAARFRYLHGTDAPVDPADMKHGKQALNGYILRL